MSQGRPQPSNPNERLGEEIPIAHHAVGLRGQLPLPPHEDGNTSALPPGRYWRLFNDPGSRLPDPAPNILSSSSRHSTASPTRSKL
ncbi:hypothetical protein GW17_00046627 [Ensete ventricosum]|nr:hypothetical protein GW17_00046627 [Ensete ventricosum]